MPTIYRNIHLIHNPAARRLQRSDGSFIPEILGALRAGGHGVTDVPTSEPGEATRFARRAVDSGADLVLVAGGDGTVNEVLNGVALTDTPFAVLPLGTANVLATELGIPRQPAEAARQVGEWAPERVPVGFLQTPEDGRFFLMMAGVGLDASIVVDVDPELKKRFGKIAYWIGGFGKLGRSFPQFEVAVDGERWRSSFTLASRVRNYGGDLEIAKTACLLDDYFEMVSFEGEDSFRYVMYLTGVLANLLDRMEGVTIRKTRELEFTTCGDQDIYVQVDGELAGKLPATIELAPDALTLLMPGSFRERFANRATAAEPAPPVTSS